MQDITGLGGKLQIPADGMTGQNDTQQGEPQQNSGQDKKFTNHLFRGCWVCLVSEPGGYSKNQPGESV